MIAKDPKLVGSDFTIRDINIVNVLPDWAIEAMTGEEQRKYLQDNYPVELSIAEESKQKT